METVLGRSGLCKKGIPIPHGKFTLPWSLAREVLLTAAPLSGEESGGGGFIFLSPRETARSVVPGLEPRVQCYFLYDGLS